MEVFAVPYHTSHTIRGRNEFEIYKNYVGDHSSFSILRTTLINQCFEAQQHLKAKDNLKSQQIRKEGNEDFKYGNYVESAVTYTKSLCYATYNSEAYATSLANRSAAFFKDAEYEACIKDIDLCLQASYPANLKPKVCIRKAECYQKLGDSSKMRAILVDVLNVIDSLEPSLKQIAENYRKAVKELITQEADKKEDEVKPFDTLPTFDPNPLFLGASTSVELQHTKHKGARVVAKKELVPGDILFVEKAYAFVSNYDNETFPIHCQNCLKAACSCVPCKDCVGHLYCSEECRDAAWNDFHQWECTGLQAGFFNTKKVGYLSLRILFKGLHTGLPMNSLHFKNGVINNYGNVDDNYPYVYSLPTNIDKIDKTALESFASVAETFVIYLKLKTNFFEHLKKWPAYANKSDKELTNKIGGLIIRHIAQLHRSEIKISDVSFEFPITSRTVGAAVCPSLAMVTHSCKPNTTYYFIGDIMVVKALENIKPNEEIHHAYRGINLYFESDFKVRQAILLKECFLNCKCLPCTNPKMTTTVHNAYICVRCKGPIFYEWHMGFCIGGTCLDCNYKGNIPPEVVLKEKLIFDNLVKFHNLDDLEAANRSLQVAKTLYQPYHELFRKLYEKMVEYYLHRGNIIGHMKMLKITIEHYDKFYGNLSLLSGIIRITGCVTTLMLLGRNPFNRCLQVRKIMDEIKHTLEEAKIIMDLQFPPFLKKVSQLEKVISKVHMRVEGFM